MTLTEAVQILRALNEWRRHDGLPCDPPHDGKTIGHAIDLVCDVAPELLRELEEVASAITSLNAAPRHRVKRGDEFVYPQREEWIRWMIDEVVPSARAVIAKAGAP